MASIYVAHSRWLLDKALKYGDKLRDEGHLVFIPGKRIRVRDDKKKFNTEIDILAQKLDAIKGADEIHLICDNNDPDVAEVCGIAEAFGKKVVTVMEVKSSFQRYLWEKRAPRPAVNPTVTKEPKKNGIKV